VLTRLSRGNHEHVWRRARKGAPDFIHDLLAGGDETRDFGGMDTDQELQVAAVGKIPDRFQNPFQHVGERVGRVVQLGVPEDIGEQPDAGFGEIDPDLGFDRVKVEIRSVVKPDPVPGALPAAFQVVQELCFNGVIPRHLFPAFNRFGHQRVVIGVLVTENEAIFSIGLDPVDHPHTVLARHLPDQPHGDIDAVVKNGAVKKLTAEEFAHGEGRDQGRLEIAAQHRLRMGLAFEIALGKEPQGAGHGVFPNGQCHPGGNRGLPPAGVAVASAASFWRASEESSWLYQ
jgi:hypothetical protein